MKLLSTLRLKDSFSAQKNYRRKYRMSLLEGYDVLRIRLFNAESWNENSEFKVDTTLIKEQMRIIYNELLEFYDIETLEKNDIRVKLFFDKPDRAA